MRLRKPTPVVPFYDVRAEIEHRYQIAEIGTTRPAHISKLNGKTSSL
ncbi:MAG TPA: hypothetical protein VGN20_11695 [Mucilaginibacter sp.]